MVTRRHIVSYACATLVVAAFAAALAQEVVVEGGPPPVLRARMDALQKAFNTGDPARWEEMAKAHFTERFLKSQTAAQRRQSYTATRAAFGTYRLQSGRAQLAGLAAAGVRQRVRRIGKHVDHAGG